MSRLRNVYFAEQYLLLRENSRLFNDFIELWIPLDGLAQQSVHLSRWGSKRTVIVDPAFQ